MLSVAITMADDSSYPKALKVADSAGMQKIGEMQINWNEVETSPETYTYPVVNIAKTYFRAKSGPILLTISPFYANEDGRPTDLRGLTLDDPIVIGRFNKMLSWVFSEFQKEKIEVDIFVLGNEFDTGLFIHFNSSWELLLQKWSELTNLYEAAYKHVKTISPDTLITTEMTYGSIVGHFKAQALRINQMSDIIGVSYYPMDPNNNEARDPAVVEGDFRRLIQLYPGKKLYFFQYGYPSSPLIGGSLEKQQAFIRETFKAWDRFSDNVKWISFTWLHELSDQLTEAMAGAAGSTDEKALAFFGSIGLRSYSGIDKPAWKQLELEAKKRGW